MASIRWTEGAVELRQNNDGELFLEKAGPKADPEMTFTRDQLPALFATIAASKLNCQSNSLLLFGKEPYESSEHPKAIPAAITVEKKGQDRPHAYSAKQIMAIEPKGYDLRLSFYRPQLWVYTTDFKASRGGGNKTERRTLAIKRVEPSAKKIKREEA